MGKKPFPSREGESMHRGTMHVPQEEGGIDLTEKEGLLFSILHSINSSTVVIEDADDYDLTSLIQQGPFVLDPN